MARRTAAARLAFEPLEARDVPAIIIDVALNADMTDYAPVGGFVKVEEVAIDESIQVVFRDGSPVDPTSRPANSADVVTLNQSGSDLLITSSDGVYGRAINFNNNIVFFGNALTVPNVTGLGVSMLLGGDDRLTESTPFAVNIDVGPGNDTVRVAGGAFNPALAQLLAAQGGLQQLITIGSTSSPAKTIRGGSGNDNLTATGALSNLTMFGDAGDDVLNVPTFAALANLNGGFGNDTINGPQFGFLVIINGNAGADTLRGPLIGNANLIDGGADNDVIIGSLGTDFLIGGSGSDVIVGLGGQDVYLTTDVELDFVLNVPGDRVSADPFDSLAFRLPAFTPPLRTRGF